MKFKAIEQEYTCAKKAHKKLSIENCKRTLWEYFPDKVKEFFALKKYDDVSDAFNQMFIYGLCNNIIDIPMEEYKKVVIH
jgi:hypothetical protein